MNAKNIIICIAAALLLASCATNAGRKAASVSGTVFDYAYDGIPSTSYKDFLWGKDGEYFVNGPEKALGPDAADGWKQKCLAGLKRRGEYVYIIKYLDNDETSAIDYIDIYEPNADLFLSRYIGRRAAAVLADFPLGAGIDDREYPDELYYDAADVTIQFLLKGKTVAQIRILPKKAADTGKRRAKINADWWAEAE